MISNDCARYMYPFRTMCIRLFVHFYPHRFINEPNKINSYVAQKMYAFPIADGDATCRMCSKEEQVPGRGA